MTEQTTLTETDLLKAEVAVAQVTLKPPRKERYSVRLQKMPNRVLRGEIRVQLKKAREASQPEGILVATILGIMFDSTKYTNKKAKMDGVVR